MLRKICILFPLGVLAFGLSGCGGGLTDVDAGYKSSLEFELGGQLGPTDVSRAVITVSKLELRATGTETLQTIWDGSTEVDLFAEEPEVFPGEIVLGDETFNDFDLLRVHISHVDIQDPTLGNWDQDVAWTIDFPLDVRMLAGRIALLRAILPFLAIEVQDDELVLNEERVHQANGTVDGVLVPLWKDAIYLDLSNLSYEIELPSGEDATGIWFSNRSMGFLVDDPDGTKGKFYALHRGELELLGTYKYDDPRKNTLTWETLTPTHKGVRTGTAYALRAVCPMKANAWNAILMPGNRSECPLFIIAKLDAQKNIIDIYGGEVEVADKNDPSKGGTVAVISLYDLWCETGVEPLVATLTYDGKISGKFTFAGDHDPLPANGTWTLYLPSE